MLLYQLLGGYLPYEPEKHLTKVQLKRYRMLNNDCDKSLFVDECLFEKAKKEKLLQFSSLPLYTDKRLIQIIRKATKANYIDRYCNAAELRIAIHKLGNLPNWHRNDDLLICEDKKHSYRVVKMRNSKYQIECNYSNKNWSRLRGSALLDCEESAIKYLSNHVQ